MAVRTLSPVAITVLTSQDLRVYMTSEVSFFRRFYMTSKPRKVNLDSTSSLLRDLVRILQSLLLPREPTHHTATSHQPDPRTDDVSVCSTPDTSSDALSDSQASDAGLHHTSTSQFKPLNALHILLRDADEDSRFNIYRQLRSR